MLKYKSWVLVWSGLFFLISWPAPKRRHYVSAQSSFKMHKYLKSNFFLPPLVLQVSVSTGTKKLVAATAFGAVSLLFLARHFQRRKGRKRTHSPQWEQAGFEFSFPALVENGKTHWHRYFLSSHLAGFLPCDLFLVGKLSCWFVM